MKKKTFIAFLLIALAGLATLSSCNTNNNNPTVPAPLPTSTSTPTSTVTKTPTATPTFTPTAVPTGTAVPCNTPVTFSAPPNAPSNLAGGTMYSNQVTLGAASNIDQVLVNTNGASSTSGTLQVGLYSDNGLNYPGRLLFTSSTQSFTSTGNTTYTFTITPFSLPAGKYWITSYSSIAYNPCIDQGSGIPTYTASGQFPTSFPTGGAASLGTSPWSYELDTCQ